MGAFGIARSDDLLFIQSTVFNTPSAKQKKAIPTDRRVAAESPGIRPEEPVPGRSWRDVLPASGDNPMPGTQGKCMSSSMRNAAPSSVPLSKRCEAGRVDQKETSAAHL
jgi:hypothetical protein